MTLYDISVPIREGMPVWPGDPGLWRQEGFRENFVYLTAEAAAFLVAVGVRLLGIDYLSVEGYRVEGAPAHLTLLRAGVFLLEGIDLSAVPPGDYELLCLPLRIASAEGAPARALLRTLQ